MASSLFNENLCSKKKVSKTGEQYYKVIWPKYKDGGEVVREGSIPPIYDNDVCSTGNKFLVYFLLFDLCTGHIVNSKTFNFQE